MTATATATTATDWIGRAQALKLRVRDFIDGKWRDETGDALVKYSSRDGSVLARFGVGETRSVDEAVASARKAFEDGRWSRMAPQKRKQILCKLADLMRKHQEELGLLECLDVGKPITAAVGFDAPHSANTIENSAWAADHLFSQVYATSASNLCYELRRPMGVVAGIVGWNFPLVLASQKIGPALATGNSLVLKPSEFTSLSAARVAELAVEAGVPEGVFNVVHGNGAIGAALSMHRGVDMLSFTGSTATGKKLMIASGSSNMKRLLLECGGKAPNIVFDDAPDLNAVADAVAASAYRNQGQVCSASSRLLVQESIKDKFMPLLIERVAKLTPADPLKTDTTFGALMNHDHQKKVLNYIESGEKEGARALYRSTAAAPFEKGAYVAPVVFDNVSPTQKIAQEEIFGPVLSTISFRDEADAIRIANGTIYGLSATIWTQNLGRAHRMAHGVLAGSIAINGTGKPGAGPSDGVLSSGGLKESGLGVEGGLDGLKQYTCTSSVRIFV